MIGQINNIALLWWHWMSAMFWQVGLLIILIACIDAVIKRWAWPQLRYALWLLVLLKLVLPPGFSTQSNLTVRLQPIAGQIVGRVISESSNIAETFSGAVTPEPVVTAPLILSPAEVATRLPQLATEEDINKGAAVVINQPVRPVWQAYAMVVWLLGVFVLGFWLLFKLHILRKGSQHSKLESVLPQSFHNTMSRCARQLKLRHIPSVVVTDKVVCPAVFGVFRPVLLMPEDYLSKLSRKDSEHMVLHELAHIKRGDSIVHSFCMMLQISYWFNPLLWLARRQIHHLRELCCDVTVAHLLREKTIEYRETLMDVARRFLARSVEPGLGLLGLFEDSNRLLVRLNWLEKKTWRYRKMKNIVVITIVILMAAFILPMAKAEDNSAVGLNMADSEQTERQLTESKEQLTEELQALKARLRQLETDKQQLQNSLVQFERQIEPLEDELDEEWQELEEEFKEEFEDIAEEIDELEWPEQMGQWFQGEDMQKWQDKIKGWHDSEEFKQWQKRMQHWKKRMKEWAKGMEKMGKNKFDFGRAAPKPVPMPVMPQMPPMPEIPEIKIDIPAAVDTPIEVKVPDKCGHSSRNRISCTQNPRDHEVCKSKDGKYVADAEMNFQTEIKPNASFVVRNRVGNIILSPGKDGNITAKAVIRAKGKTSEEAQEMIEQVKIDCRSSDDSSFLGVTKPDDNHWNDLNVDFYIKVPPGVQLDVKTNIGSIELFNLEGKIKAVTNMGSIKTVETCGDVELTTNMGDIDFIAPSDISAKFKVKTDMGTIESELPLDIDTSKMMKRKAKGIVGSGQDNISMTTNMGNVNVKWLSSP